MLIDVEGGCWGRRGGQGYGRLVVRVEGVTTSVEGSHGYRG